MSQDAAVLDVNRSFYEAFKDFDRMAALWSLTGPVFCIHPGQEPITNRNMIMDSWKNIISSEQLSISPINEQIVWYGRFAMVLCHEIITEKPVPWNELLITSNLIVPNYPTGWKIAGHHAGRKR
jgi:hypothetical protein